MDSNVNQNIVFNSEGKLVPIDITNLSPVTNLALNLSGLSTSVAGTPVRRISWSNPIPGGDKIGLNLDDLSPSNTDSPTFQNVLKNHSKPKPKLHKYNRVPFSDSEEDKENFTPKLSGNLSTNDDFECFSQDSGYSSTDISTKQVFSSPSCSKSFTKIRSSTFTYNEDSMENIFKLDTNEDTLDLLAVPENMSSLLMKPLSSNIKSHHSIGSSRKGRLPIRRCLSMDITSDSESDTNTPNSGTYLSLSTIIDEKGMEIDSREKGTFKRPDPPSDYAISSNKRRKSSPCVEGQLGLLKQNENFIFKRSYSETAATIMHAILKSDLQPELIGDGTRSYVLPLIKGRHQDLKGITPETLARLLKGEFVEEIESYALIDCRYPYEYEGGHIQGARNIFTKEEILEQFLKADYKCIKKSVMIFHCEFSSERAPNLCRFLRNKDREMNQGNYPHLNHPEIYILEGGYKAFYEDYKELCEPQSYKPMNHKDHGFELRHFRAKSKSWGAESKSRTKLRSSSKTSII